MLWIDYLMIMRLKSGMIIRWRLLFLNQKKEEKETYDRNGGIKY